MDLIDIGANLTHENFHIDLNEVIDRAQQAGVTRMIVTGSNERESRAAQRLAADYPGLLYATAGVHPHEARHFNAETSSVLAELVALPQVVAVGETGLDFNRNFSPQDDQEQAFAAQLALAVELAVPVFMHERDAHERFIAILARYRAQLDRAVIHCFTGNAEELAAYLDLDLYVGITGWICDERRGLHLRDLVRRIPLERLLLETDAPYLLPRSMRSKPKSRRNEPAFLVHVLETVAQSLDLPMTVVAEASTRNAERFFGLLDNSTYKG